LKNLFDFNGNLLKHAYTSKVSEVAWLIGL